MTNLDYDRFEVLTFDCYGTLIDWERGLVTALRAALGVGAAEVADDDCSRFRGTGALHEVPYQPYRDVLAARRGTSRSASASPWTTPPQSSRRLGRRLARVPGLPGRPAAPQEVQARCHDELRRRPLRRLEERLGVRFDKVMTAAAAAGYKPIPRFSPFPTSSSRAARDRILHVAQSLFHDHVPAKLARHDTVWIDRRGRPGGGARARRRVAGRDVP